MTGGLDHHVEPGPDPHSLIRRKREGSEGLSAEAEARLLGIIGPRVPLRVPQVIEVLSKDAMKMERIPGEPLLGWLRTRRPLSQRTALATELGRFVGALAGIPRPLVQGLVPTEGAVLAEYHAEVMRLSAGLLEEVPRSRRAAVARFASRRPPVPTTHLVLAHSDLGAEHVLVGGAGPAIQGVIDFSDAAISDCAVDLGLLMRDLGVETWGHVLTAYASTGADMDGVRMRALFYARAKALEDLAFGLESLAADYRDNALRALGELFADVA